MVTYHPILHFQSLSFVTPEDTRVGTIELYHQLLTTSVININTSYWKAKNKKKTGEKTSEKYKWVLVKNVLIY